MRRRRKEKMRDFMVGSLKRKVSALMENRHRLLAPFPVDPNDLYRMLWTDEEWEAIGVLLGTNDLLNRQQSLYIVGLKYPNDLEKDCNISVRLNIPKPMGSINKHHFENLPEDMQKQIKEWMPLWVDMRHETSTILTAVEELAEECTTYGQVLRIWPELESFFEEAGAEAIARAKARSPYPAGVLVRDPDNWDKRILSSNFQPQRYADYTQMIAECLMLPVLEGKHIGVVEDA